MTILIFGYIVAVGLSVYFVSKFAKSAKKANDKAANLKLWLDEAATSLDETREELRVAYRVIDKMQDERDGTSFASEIGNIIDNVEHAGAYFDGDGMPQLDRMDWTPQDGVSYSESDDSDV